MTPRELIGTAIVPGGGEELKLFRRGGDHMIVLDRNELMSSRMSGSEEALADLVCTRLSGRTAPRLLIGGYGMGFTLRAALKALGKDARVTVAELVPEIIEWARGPMAAMTGTCLDDKRVTLAMGDVAGMIGGASGEWDAILLDVDNGPDGLTRDANDRLYSMSGLAAARAALAPIGLLAVWSAAPDRVFAKRFAETGFKVEEIAVRARSNGKGGHHTIWIGARGR